MRLIDVDNPCSVLSGTNVRRGVHRKFVDRAVPFAVGRHGGRGSARFSASYSSQRITLEHGTSIGNTGPERFTRVGEQPVSRVGAALAVQET